MQKLSAKDRFWPKVNRLADTTKCWLWQAATTPNRRKTMFYGHFVFNGKDAKAHRVAYELTNGPIPKGKLVLHICNVSLCCNPSHLYVGTHADNMADRRNASRQNYRLGELHGRAKLTSNQVAEARKRYHEGGVTKTQLAAEYGVCKVVMGLAINRKTWKHLL